MIDAALNDAEALLKTLEQTLERYEVALVQIERSIELAASAAVAGNPADASKAIVDSLLDELFAKVDEPIEAGLDALKTQFMPIDVFEDLAEEVFEAHDRAGALLAEVGQEIFEEAERLSDELEKGTDRIEAEVSGWIESAEATADEMSDGIEAAVEALSATAPAVDNLLDETISAKLVEHIDIVADAAEGYLRQVEVAIDSAGGKLFAGLGEIGQKVESVAEILRTIKPMTDAFDALT